MALLDEAMENDAAAFVDTDVFGESITYTPGDGSGAVSRNAVVIRRLPELVAGTAAALAPVIDVWIRNHATLGVSAVDRGSDMVSVATKVGGTAAAHAIDQIVEQDSAMWHLRLR